MLGQVHREVRVDRGRRAGVPAKAGHGVVRELSGCRELRGLRPGGGTQSDWRYYTGDAAATKYSPLDQIDRGNVSELRVLWRRPAVDARYTEAFPELVASPNLRGTPIFINGVLYAPNGVGLVEAFDPGTGETLWVQEPTESGLRGVAGGSTRGVAFWSDGSEQRLFSTRGEYLYALDAKTGNVLPAFGDNGRVNLSQGSDSPWADRFNWTSGPLVVGDIIIVAGNNGGAGDSGVTKEAAPGDVRGFDVRTGRLRWTFHVMPRPGEFGSETWPEDSWTYEGAMGSWAPISADVELGRVYIGLSAPNMSSYGGHRPGQNLFANTLVCLDATTGDRLWHFQVVHHDLWDSDLLTPVLGDITVDGTRIKAVIQLSKLPYLYVFDRITGEPVWPIEERPVPPSTVPGEEAWPTQPIPTRPPPFDLHGFSLDDAIDFTPELRAQAIELLEPYVLGPAFTPPSLINNNDIYGIGSTRGTFVVPGPGSANFNGGAFDPETSMIYVVSHTLPYVVGLFAPTPSDLPPGSNKTTLRYAANRHLIGNEGRMPGSELQPSPRQGLPFTKPPYGRVTAIDLDSGEHVWMAANGDGQRNHPALTGLDIPPLGVSSRPTPLLTKTLLFLGEGSDALPSIVPTIGRGKMFRAYDKATGTVLWEIELPGGAVSGPMTYLFDGKQYIVVPVGDRQNPAEWVALGLP